MANSLSHIVFPVKYWKALLNEVVTTMIQETAVEIAERLPIEREAIGTDKNHIHLLCGAHLKVAPGRSTQIFKHLMVREIVRRKPAVKRVLWSRECWAAWYQVAARGERANWEVVERYMQPQEDLRQFQMY
jgi:putative transposase